MCQTTPEFNEFNMINQLMSGRLLRQRAPVVLLLGAGVIVLGLWLLTLLPGMSIQQSENGSPLFFAADRRLVLKPSDCVTVRWEVENIDSIYLNGEGVVGAGEQPVCVSQDVTPVFRVVFSDGSSRNTTLWVGVLVANPITWILALLALCMVVAASYLTVGRRLVKHLIWLGRPLRKLMTVLVLLILALAVGAGILEICLRLYLTNFGTEFERRRYLYSAEQLSDSDFNTNNIPLPFLNWGPAGGGDNNSLGYRNEEFQIPKPDGVYRIVAMGNSTSYGTGMARKFAYPAQLQKILRNDYGYTNVEVLNAGIAAGTSWHGVVDFAFRILEVQPDLVILYYGNTDVGAALQDPECFQGMNPHRGISPGTGVWQTHHEPIPASTLYRYIAINMGWMETPATLIQPIERVIECAKQRTLSDEEASQANPPVYFERNLKTLVGVAQIHEVEVLISTWAYFPDAIDQEFTPLWFQQAVDRYNEVTREVTRELNVLFYDLQANLPYGADLWQSDGSHLSKKGTREQAERFAAYIVEQGLIPKPELP
jgi:lysophospholipase L1-like esterase